MNRFLITIGLLLSNCNEASQKSHSKAVTETTTNPIPQSINEPTKTYIDSFEAEFILREDTGYFKNLAAYKVDMLGYPLKNQLDTFLDRIVSKKGILLLNKSGLSHSCWLIDKGNIRFDTFRNGKTSFIQKQRFGFNSENDRGDAVLKINGRVTKAVSVVDSEYELFLDFNPASFRQFTFHGNEFYYIHAKYSASFGGSMGNVSYHLLYDVLLNKLFYVNSCRLPDWVPYGDVNNDGTLDFIDFNNSEFCTTIPSNDRVIIQFYSYKNGRFILQKDKSGVVYSIEGNTGSNYTHDSFKIRKSYWPVEINLAL
jgi:hypothetical protein